MKMAITSCALWAFTGNSVGCCTFAWLRTFWTHRYCYHCQPQQASSIEAATSLIDCETPMEVCNTDLHRECMLADTLTKGAGWINGVASCRSDELKSPDTQSFLNIYSIIKKNNTNGRVDADPEPKSFEKPVTKTHILSFPPSATFRY